RCRRACRTPRTTIPLHRLQSLSARDAGVEVGDHLIPDRQETSESTPELLRATSLEQFEWRALLFDPCVVPEVEDPRAISFGAFDRICSGHVGQVLAPDRGCIEVGEPPTEVSSGDLVALARVKRRAV